MTAADDLIRRQDAIQRIHAELKRTYTASRRQGFKAALEVIERVPTARCMEVSMANPVVVSPGLGRSHWFTASDWLLCDNCGGRCEGWKPTPFCPHCGARMDLMMDAEIE